MRGHGGVGFTRVHAVVHARNLGHPVAEALPDLVAAEERIGCGVGFAAARSGQRADGAAAIQNALVEVDVLGPDFVQEVDGGRFFLGAGQNIPA